MATRNGPRFKECRRLGVNVCGHPKAMRRMDSVPMHNRKQSEYKLQLTEKQKLKAYYGILERQMLNYYKRAHKSSAQTGTALLILLESRLDNIVYRIGFARSIRMARQMVTHGHILVNGRWINIPSYELKPGDRIELKEDSRKNEPFRINFQDLRGFDVPYLSKDLDAFSAVYLRYPEREELPIEINEQNIVEFYSR